jgi:hypothetical protein
MCTTSSQAVVVPTYHLCPAVWHGVFVNNVWRVGGPVVLQLKSQCSLCLCVFLEIWHGGHQVACVHGVLGTSGTGLQAEVVFQLAPSVFCADPLVLSASKHSQSCSCDRGACTVLTIRWWMLQCALRRDVQLHSAWRAWPYTRGCVVPHPHTSCSCQYTNCR